MGSEVVKWGDNAQYLSAPVPKNERGEIVPQAHLLWATPDPLGAIAAVSKMFKGIPTYDLADITDEERRFFWEDSFKTHLRAPHEFVQFHFMIEGVTRSHTHQMVRQRTATFAQESLRFAVKEGLADEVPKPPSILPGDERANFIWNETIAAMAEGYEALVNSGIPAEDARGLLPHAVTTRLHWRTSLNDLLHHAGNRLCTQAQFEWRYLLLAVMKAIREYVPINSVTKGPHKWAGDDFSWQFETIGSPAPRTFAPICYQLGKCQFDSSVDRPCSIRNRVDRLALNGVSSEHWGDEGMFLFNEDGEKSPLEPIRYEEWLLNPDAAR